MPKALLVHMRRHTEGCSKLGPLVTGRNRLPVLVLCLSLILAAHLFKERTESMAFHGSNFNHGYLSCIPAAEEGCAEPLALATAVALATSRHCVEPVPGMVLLSAISASRGSKTPESDRTWSALYSRSLP